VDGAGRGRDLEKQKGTLFARLGAKNQQISQRRGKEKNEDEAARSGLDKSRTAREGPRKYLRRHARNLKRQKKGRGRQGSVVGPKECKGHASDAVPGLTPPRGSEGEDKKMIARQRTDAR